MRIIFVFVLLAVISASVPTGLSEVPNLNNTAAGNNSSQDIENSTTVIHCNVTGMWEVTKHA